MDYSYFELPRATLTRNKPATSRSETITDVSERSIEVRGARGLYGTPIPILYGKTRVQGNMLWLGNGQSISTYFPEADTTTTENPTIYNSVSFPGAFVFGQRDPNASLCKFLRVWLNGQLIYDITGELPQYVLPGVSISLYTGGEDQLPDPVITAAVEALGGAAPAFRGLIYCVIGNVSLESGQFPVVQAEIIQSSPTVMDVVPLTDDDPTTMPSYNLGIVNWNSETLYCYSYPDLVDVYSLNSTGYARFYLDAANPNVIYHSAFSRNGQYLFTTYEGLLNQVPLGAFDMNAGGALVATIGDTGATPYITEGPPLRLPSLLTLIVGRGIDEDRGDTIYGVSTFDLVYFVKWANQAFTYLTYIDTYYNSDTSAVDYLSDVTVIAKSDPLIKNHPFIPKFTMAYLGHSNKLSRIIFTGDAEEVISINDNNQTFSRATENRLMHTFDTNERVVNICCGPANDAWVSVLTSNSSTFVSKVYHFSTHWSRGDGVFSTIDDLNLIASGVVPYVADWAAKRESRQADFARDHYFRHLAAGGIVNIINMKTATYETINPAGIDFINPETEDVYSNYAFNFDLALDYRKGYFIFGRNAPNDVPYPNKCYFARDLSGATTLAALIESFSVTARYASTDIEIIGLTDVLTGAIINQSVRFFDLLQALADVFRFDILETGGKIKVSRHNSDDLLTVEETLTDANLALLEQGEFQDHYKMVGYSRDGSNETPNVVNLSYIDGEHNNIIGTQTARRAKFPFATVSNDVVREYGIPVIMGPDEALYWTSQILFDAWSKRQNLKFRLSQKYINLDPGDYVSLSLDNGDNYTVKLLSTEVNGDFSITLDAETIAQFTTFPKPNKPLPTYEDDALPIEFDPILVQYFGFVEDALLVNDTYAIYWNAPSACSLWIGNELKDTTSGGYCGKLTHTLAKNSYVFSIDTENSITIELTDPSKKPASVTTDEFLAGQSYVVIGDNARQELIYFRDVTDNLDGTITLSYLSRGRRNTDTFLNHRVGEWCFFNVRRIYIPRSQARRAIVATLTPPGGSPAGLGSRSAAVYAFPGSVAPFTPVNVLATIAGSDVELTWTRRTRLATDIHDGDGDTPEDETSVNYQVRITKADGTLRTYEVTTEAVTYTAADMTADGYASIPTTLLVGISKKSAIFGAYLSERGVTVNVG